MFYALQHFLEEVRVLVKIEATGGDDGVKNGGTIDQTNLSNQSSQLNQSNQLNQSRSSIDQSSSAQNQNEKQTVKQYYSRADLCEVEPTIVTCLLRLCVRYVAEIEAVDRTGNTPYQNTLSTYVIDILYQSILSTYPVNTPSYTPYHHHLY